MNLLDRLIRKTHIYDHRTNAPFLSGDSFASLCDSQIHSLDWKTFKIERHLNSRSIFIKSNLLQDFLQLNHDLPTLRLVVAGNSDTNFDSIYRTKYSNFEIYCQNFAGEKTTGIHTLPLGLENVRHAGSGQKKYFRQTEVRKELGRVLVPPHGNTNLLRQLRLKEIASNTTYQISENLLSRKGYFKLTNKFRFILCLEGNGFDTHRVWETLYQDSFPVVLKSAWSDSLQYLGLPILYLENLNMMSSALLDDHLSKYGEFKASECEVLWCNYWDKTFSRIKFRGA